MLRVFDSGVPPNIHRQQSETSDAIVTLYIMIMSLALVF